MSSSSSTMPSITTNCKESSPVNLPYLPDDIVLNCLARVSRLYYPSLFLVSKRFRSLLASNSKEIYKIRKHLGCTESCLYVCLVSEVNPYWFILGRKPARIPNTNPKPTLVSIPSEDYFPTYGWDVVAVGSNIYMIGGSNYNDDDELSAKVFIMDCRSHTWCEAPSMRVAPKKPSTSFFDGKIYVAGRIKDNDSNSLNWFECFDPKTQKWEQYVPSPFPKTPWIEIYKSLVIEGKLYLLGEHESVLVYKPNEDRWDAVELDMRLLRWKMERAPDSFCFIDSVWYYYDQSRQRQRVEWYDFKRSFGGVLKGVEELMAKIPKYCYVRFVNYGGKLAVLWEENESEFWGAIGNNEKMIWCAEISLEWRDNEQEIYGKIEWCEIVFKVPKSCYLDKCIAVTV